MGKDGVIASCSTHDRHASPRTRACTGVGGRLSLRLHSRSSNGIILEAAASESFRDQVPSSQAKSQANRQLGGYCTGMGTGMDSDSDSDSLLRVPNAAQ
jgi:hypothetical protein